MASLSIGEAGSGKRPAGSCVLALGVLHCQDFVEVAEIEHCSELVQEWLLKNYVVIHAEVGAS